MVRMLCSLAALAGAVVAAKCLDEAPDASFSCQQQKEWGKCSEDWMVGFCCSTCFGCASGCGAPAPRAPCDPEATPAAAQLLAYLYDISGKHTLTGQVERDQHNDDGGSATGTRYDWDKVAEITGQHPALYGNQFLWGSASFTKPLRQAWVDRATQLWRGDEGKGQGITHVNFHVCPPQPRFRDFRCAWEDIEGNPPNATLVDAILAEGSEEQRIWFEQLDAMAEDLKQLQRNGVPVLWRPFHEMNGGWFWWGATPRFGELWRQLFQRYTKQHELHNLLWVWGASGTEPSMEDYYPGGDVVDALGLDIYGGAFSQAVYDEVVSLADGRVVALAEVGQAPTEALLRGSQPRYAWFLMWGDFEESANDPKELTALYNSDWFLTQGEVSIGSTLLV